MTRLRWLALLCLAGCDDVPAGPPQPQPAPAGAVAQGDAARRAALAMPGPPATAALLARGAERYAIFCAPCHGRTGAGDGPVVLRGFPAPPPLPAEAARTMAALATNHAGAHPFAQRLTAPDAWAIARFVEGL